MKYSVPGNRRDELREYGLITRLLLDESEKKI